jgi:predicted dithiol-disulfide oxidoreductase (DUF899 family)
MPWQAEPGEKGGVSVFLRDGSDVLHTYTAYGAATELIRSADAYMDLTPSGRRYDTLKHHDRY